MLSDSTFSFELRKPIEVAGCHDPVTSLTLHECGEGYDGYYMKLRKFVVSAQMKTPKLLKDFGDFIKQDNDQGLSAGDEVKPLHQIDEKDHLEESKGFAELLKMTLGTSDHLENLVKVFGYMLCNKGGNAICTADGDRLKEGAWSRIHPEDKIDMAVQYCAFFAIGLDQALNNASDTAPESHTEVKQL